MSKLRVGVAGPVGSGKTALVEALCRRLRDRLQLAVVTNDIYTQEDAQFLTRAGALEPERIRGVETGGCPHTAIREDCSINRAAVAELEAAFPDLDLVLVESGGDNLAASFSPELVDLCIYVVVIAGSWAGLQELSPEPLRPLIAAARWSGIGYRPGAQVADRPAAQAIQQESTSTVL